MFKEMFQKPILVFGCGNILFGDDGFGPAVMDALEKGRPLPDSVMAADVGTSIRDLLFDLLLSPKKPEKILIIDASDKPGRRPGGLAELGLDQVDEAKVNDFSVHQFPSLNLLKELDDQEGVQVSILAVQVQNIPDHVAPGLSPLVQEAVPRACQWIWDQIERVP